VSPRPTASTPPTTRLDTVFYMRTSVKERSPARQDKAVEPIPADEFEFRFNSNQLCLNFVATLGERWRRSIERLRTPADLGRWLVAAELLERAPAVTSRQLTQARELREAIWRVAKALIDEATPRRADVALINGWVRRPPLAPQFEPRRRRIRTEAQRPVEQALSTIARDAVLLFGGQETQRLRECARPDCAVLFVDRSRAGRRRWCTMSSCGNKTKTAAYRRRRRQRLGRVAGSANT
jgi:predicted RNA-binding Zn ribbon-like protein